MFFNLDQRIDHEIAVLGLLKMHLKRALSAYMGAGLVVFPSVKRQFFDNAFGGQDAGINENRTMYGGMGQAGLEYCLGKHWFADLSYTFAMTGLEKFEELSPSVGAYIRGNFQLMSQEAMMTLNYRFGK